MGILEKLKEMTTSNKRAVLVVAPLTLLVVVVVIAVVVTSTNSAKDDPSDNYGAPWTNPRLSKDLKPKHYDITIHIDVTEKKFWGTETIEIDITAANISTILLHAYNILIPQTSTYLRFYCKKLSEDRDKEHEVDIKRHHPFAKNHYHVIYLKKYLKPEDDCTYFLDVEWSGELNYKFSGLYLSDYVEDGEKRQTVSSQFQPISAREAFPCFDEPEFKATVDMTIVTEQNYSFVTWNTVQVGKTETFTENEKSWKKMKFARSPVMSMYVMAFVVANYKCKTKTTTSNLEPDKEILLRVCGRPSLIDGNYAEHALNVSEHVLKYFETYFNQPYPLSKCDHVGISDFEAGAMENWGLIIYREELLFFNEENDETESKGKVNLVVSHETAHMWFGNLVTLKWWNDVWLNEGFATYVQGLGTQDSTEYDNDKFLINEWRVTSMSKDSYISSRPASVVVTDPANIHYLFDAIAYNKGASLLRQLNMVMDNTDGDNDLNKSFKDGVRNYLAANKYSNANQSQLYQALNATFVSKAAPGLTVDQIMKTWTLQMNFPVVTVAQYDEMNLILSQRRFLIADENHGEGSQPSPYGYQWYVPMKYKTFKDGDAKPGISELKWIRPNGHFVMEFSKDSIFVNLDGDGFYVTSYSLGLWKKLIADLSNLQLTSREKQVLLYDTQLLVDAGYYPLSREIELLTKLSDSDDYNVLKEVFRQIDVIFSLTKMKKWKEKWAKVVKDRYDAEEQKKGGGKYVDRLMKSLTMKICLKYSDNKDSDIKCVKRAEELWNKKKLRNETIEPDYKTAVYSYAAMKSPDEWKEVWKLYLDQSSTAAEKNILSIALAQTDDEGTVNEYIGYCMNETLVRKSNGLAIMGRYLATANSVSAKVSLDYMIENWPDIYKYFKTLDLECPRYVKTVISQITTEDYRRKVKEKFEDPTSGYMVDAIKADYKSAMDTARANINWLAKNMDALKVDND